MESEKPAWPLSFVICAWRAAQLLAPKPGPFCAHLSSGKNVPLSDSWLALMLKSIPGPLFTLSFVGSSPLVPSQEVTGPKLWALLGLTRISTPGSPHAQQPAGQEGERERKGAQRSGVLGAWLTIHPPWVGALGTSGYQVLPGLPGMPAAAGIPSGQRGQGRMGQRGLGQGNALAGLGQLGSGQGGRGRGRTRAADGRRVAWSWELEPHRDRRSQPQGCPGAA